MTSDDPPSSRPPSSSPDDGSARDGSERSPADVRRIEGTSVRGVDVGPETRCAHYAGERDVIAIRSPCCDTYYPCVDCHAAVADHPAEPIPEAEFDEPGVLCGVCGTTLTVAAYLGCGFACPACGAAFNPGCAAHYDRYFER